MTNPNQILPFQRDHENVFDAAWHAQILAIVDALIQSQKIRPSQWAETLGSERKAAEIRAEPDTAETYYQCALSALEKLLAQETDLDSAAISVRRDAWARAYLATPHGKPVLLSAGK